MAHSICVVPPWWTVKEFSVHSCRDKSHTHISWKKFDDLESAGLIHWIVFRRVARLKRQVPLRDVSARTGWYVMQQARLGQMWAQVQVGEILRPATPLAE